jgi:hypothetical protein
MALHKNQANTNYEAKYDKQNTTSKIRALRINAEFANKDESSIVVLLDVVAAMNQQFCSRP